LDKKRTEQYQFISGGSGLIVLGTERRPDFEPDGADPGMLKSLKGSDPDRLSDILARAEALALGATMRRTTPLCVGSVMSIPLIGRSKPSMG
jgi:hypothetical protein